MDSSCIWIYWNGSFNCSKYQGVGNWCMDSLWNGNLPSCAVDYILVSCYITSVQWVAVIHLVVGVRRTAEEEDDDEEETLTVGGKYCRNTNRVKSAGL